MNEFITPPNKQLNEIMNDNKIVMIGADSGKSALMESQISEALKEHGAVVLSIKSGAVDALIRENAIVTPAPKGLAVEIGFDVDAIKQQVAKWIADINEREEQCLKTIHARYCIPRALHHNAADVSRYYPVDGNKNLYQYWYKFGTQQAFMLMQRELFFEDNQPKLNIVFNADLAREGE